MIQRILSPLGLEAWLVEDYAVPVVGIEFAFRGGVSQDPAGRAGLTLVEMLVVMALLAMLASFPKAPTRFANQVQTSKARERQHYVLEQMVEAGFISQAQADEAKSQELVFAKETPDTFTGHALDYAVERVREVLPNPPPDMVIIRMTNGNTSAIAASGSTPRRPI